MCDKVADDYSIALEFFTHRYNLFVLKYCTEKYITQKNV